MGGPITKELAKKIAKKLKAVNETEKNDAHDIMAVYHEGKMVASFGIRRGSNKEQSHGHIPDELGVNERFAKELGQCTKSLRQWLALRGFLAE